MGLVWPRVFEPSWPTNSGSGTGQNWLRAATRDADVGGWVFEAKNAQVPELMGKLDIAVCHRLVVGGSLYVVHQLPSTREHRLRRRERRSIRKHWGRLLVRAAVAGGSVRIRPCL